LVWNCQVLFDLGKLSLFWFSWSWFWQVLFGQFRSDFNKNTKKRGCSLQRHGIAFFPLAVCVFGSWHKEAQDQIRKAAGALARHTGQ